MGGGGVKSRREGGKKSQRGKEGKKGQGQGGSVRGNRIVRLK